MNMVCSVRLCGLRVAAEDQIPALVVVPDRLVKPAAELLPAPVPDVDPRAVARRREGDLHLLGRLLSAARVPAVADPVRRIPGEDDSPDVLLTSGGALVETAAF